MICHLNREHFCNTFKNLYISFDLGDSILEIFALVLRTHTHLDVHYSIVSNSKILGKKNQITSIGNGKV